MQRRRNRFQTLTEQTMASLKECSEEVKRDSGKRTEKERDGSWGRWQKKD